jgi:uncharacterized protein DUF4405
MNRPTLNLIVDGLALVGFIFLVATGLIMHFVLPPGSGGGPGGHRVAITIWGLSRHQWGEIHFWIAVGLLIVLSLHLSLHWRWVVSTVCGLKKESSGLRAILGILALLALLLILVAPFLATPEGR